MIHSVVLVSDIQQSALVIHIHISILFQILLPCRLLPSIEYSSVLYSKSLLIIYFTYSSVHMPIPTSQFIPPPHIFPLVTTSPL